VTYGYAAAIAARGFRVILPDLRGHGESAKPHDAAVRPRRERQAARRGRLPARHTGRLHATSRNDHFRRILTNLGAFERRSAEGKAEAFLKSTGADPVAALYLLDSGVDTPPEALAKIDVPVLVLAGAEDDDNGTAEDLAAALPRGQAARIPGNHMSAVAQPDLGAAIGAFLAAP